MAELSDLPDVTDPDVRVMVLRNHQPEESWTYGGQVDVHCATCWKPWPCPARDAAWKAEQEAVKFSIKRIEREEKPRRWWWP